MAVSGLSEGAVPKHAQLRDRLAAHARETLSPGDAMPSERELMQRFDVSRATVRRAIDQLVNDGIVVRTPGKGTYVAPDRVESHLHLASFTDDMRRRGLTPSTRVLSCQLEGAPQPVRDFLGDGVGGRHWHLVRLRLADGAPMAVEDGWYSSALIDDLPAERALSLYSTLREHHGLTIDRAEQTAWSEIADRSVEQLLQLPHPAPVMTFTRWSSATQRPVEVCTSHYRGDQYRLHMTLDGSMPPVDPSRQTPPPR